MMPFVCDPSLASLASAASLCSSQLLQSGLPLHVPCPVPPISSPSTGSSLFQLHTFGSGTDCFASAQHDRTSCFFPLPALPKLQEVTKPSYPPSLRADGTNHGTAVFQLLVPSREVGSGDRQLMTLLVMLAQATVTAILVKAQCQS